MEFRDPAWTCRFCGYNCNLNRWDKCNKCGFLHDFQQHESFIGDKTSTPRDTRTFPTIKKGLSLSSSTYSSYPSGTSLEKVADPSSCPQTDTSPQIGSSEPPCKEGNRGDGGDGHESEVNKGVEVTASTELAEHLDKIWTGNQQTSSDDTRVGGSNQPQSGCNRHWICTSCLQCHQCSKGATKVQCNIQDNVLPDRSFIEMLESEFKAISNVCKGERSDIPSNLSRQAQHVTVVGGYNQFQDVLEFYFLDRVDMAKIVGVGLSQAKVILKKGIEVEVQEISEAEGSMPWNEDRENTNKMFTILLVKLPDGSQSSEGDNIGESQAPKRSQQWNQGSESVAASLLSYQPSSGNRRRKPVIWDIAKYFILDKVISSFATQLDLQKSAGSTKCSPDTFFHKFGNDNNDPISMWINAFRVMFSRDRISSANDNIGGGDGGGEGAGGGGSGERGGGGDVDVDTTHPPVVTNEDDHMKSTKVIVTLLPGGDIFEKSGEQLTLENMDVQTLNRFKDVNITSKLVFQFIKNKNSKRIQITVGDVVFALRRDDFEKSGKFGWFHDDISVSFGVTDPNEAYLDTDFSADCEIGKTISTKTQSTERSKSTERSMEGKAILQAPSSSARLEFSGGYKHGQGNVDTYVIAFSDETSCKQTEYGFEMVAMPHFEEGVLEYQCLPPSTKVIKRDVGLDNYRLDLLKSPICKMQRTKFIGNWVPRGAGGPQLSEYLLTARRDLRQIVTVAVESTESSTGVGCSTCSLWNKNWKDPMVLRQFEYEEERKQVYQKKLYVNHVMSHLIDGEEYELTDRPGYEQPMWNQNDPLVAFENRQCGQSS